MSMLGGQIGLAAAACLFVWFRTDSDLAMTIATSILVVSVVTTFIVGQRFGQQLRSERDA
jgi:hypothetical protein